MIVKKKKKPAKSRKPVNERPKDWRAALRRYLAKVPDVDAVFVNALSGTVHVYSVVAEFTDENCDRLLAQENAVEQKYPAVPFEFHTRAHQGRKPSESGPWGSELVYLR